MNRWLLTLFTVSAVGYALLPTPAIAAYDRPGKTERITVTTAGEQARKPLLTLEPCDQEGAAASWQQVDITPNGRFVVFASDSDNLASGDLNLGCDVFIRDRVKRTTSLVSKSYDGKPLTGFSPTDPTNLAPMSRHPSVSADGRYVVFLSTATNVVPNDTNNVADVFLFDRITSTTRRVSVNSAGKPGVDGAGNPVAPYHAVISRNGRYVVFASRAGNLVANDTNNGVDVFVHDRVTHKTTRESVTTSGAQADGSGPSISDDGRFVVFDSAAPTFDPTDDNNTVDVFVRDRKKKTTTRVSVASGGGQPKSTIGDSAASGTRLLSSDGRYVAFTSFHAGLVPIDTNWAARSDLRASASDVFVHDLRTHRTERISVQSTGEEAAQGAEEFFSRGPGQHGSVHAAAAISPNGRYVVYASVSDELSLTETRVEDSDVYVYDRRTGETDWVSTTRGNAESKSLCSTAGFTNLGAGVQIASGYTGKQSWGGTVDNSGDVAFLSCAEDLVAGDTNGIVDVFVHDHGRDSGTVGESAATGGGLPLPPITTASDARGDTASPVGDLIRTRIAYRPHLNDVSIHIDAARLMPIAVPLGFGIGPSYGVRFNVAGRSYEARASRSGLASSFDLFACQGECHRIGALRGGYGTTGEAVVLTVPLADIGLAPGARLRAVEAYSAVGTAIGGPTTTLDTAVLR